MFVSEQNKFIFFHIPKTAGTSIHVSLKARFNQYQLDPLPPAHHIQPKEYLYFNENKKDFFKFCFVRNPYERVVSAFLDFQNQIFFCFDKINISLSFLLKNFFLLIIKLMQTIFVFNYYFPNTK